MILWASSKHGLTLAVASFSSSVRAYNVVEYWGVEESEALTTPQGSNYPNNELSGFLHSVVAGAKYS